MTDLEAVERRISRRSYLETPLEPFTSGALLTLVGEYNRRAGLRVELVREGAEAFRGFRRSYGMFSGVNSYFAMAGRRADLCLREKVGYWGEKLVLEATRLGLGTCWVGGTFDRAACPCRLLPDEELVCVITVGHVSAELGGKERFIYRMVHRSTKPREALYDAGGETPPDWFAAGMRAVRRAPSALNRQPVRFVWRDGAVSASVPDYASQAVDLGIAKLHFEIGAGGGSWKPGSGGAYLRGGEAGANAL